MLLVLLVAVPAFGQSTYVAGSLGADISRFSLFDVAGVDVGGLIGGEAVSAAVRVGTSLGAAWGVELEFARPSEIEENISSNIGPVPLRASTAGTSFRNRLASASPFGSALQRSVPWHGCASGLRKLWTWPTWPVSGSTGRAGDHDRIWHDRVWAAAASTAIRDACHRLQHRAD
jgi:hypothetical protein